MVLQHNLDNEKRLIEMFGYHIIGPDSSNRWHIFDENNQKVGYIQYKILSNKHRKKGPYKVWGYYTFVDSPKYSLSFSRDVNDPNGNVVDNNNCQYSFDIKTSNQDTNHVEISIGDFPSLTIWSKEYGYIDFSITPDGLYINFKSKTEKFNIEETLIYHNNDNVVFPSRQLKKYIYQIKYCQRDVMLSHIFLKGITLKEICGIQDNDCELELTILEKTFVNGRKRFHSECIVDGKVEEMAAKHQMGIDCFSYFRYIVNQIFQCPNDVMSSLISDDMIRQYNLEMFIQPSEKEESKRKVKRDQKA